MAFSEAELVFLALIFILTLVFLLLGRRNNTSTAKNTHKKKTERGAKERHDRGPAKTISTVLDEDQTKTTTTNPTILVAQYSGESS